MILHKERLRSLFFILSPYWRKIVFFTFESMGNKLEIMKNTFFESFFKNEKRLHLAIVTLHSKWRNSEDRGTLHKRVRVSMKEGLGSLHSLIRFCLGTAAGLRPSVTNVSPLECLQRSWEMRRRISNLSHDPSLLLQS